MLKRFSDARELQEAYGRYRFEMNLLYGGVYDETDRKTSNLGLEIACAKKQMIYVDAHYVAVYSKQFGEDLEKFDQWVIKSFGFCPSYDVCYKSRQDEALKKDGIIRTVVIIKPEADEKNELELLEKILQTYNLPDEKDMKTILVKRRSIFSSLVEDCVKANIRCQQYSEDVMVPKSPMYINVFREGYHSILEFEVDELEEILFRCGWTGKENIEGWNHESRTELKRLEDMEYINSKFDNDTEAAIKWWKEKVISKKPCGITPDQ